MAALGDGSIRMGLGTQMFAPFAGLVQPASMVHDLVQSEHAARIEKIVSQRNMADRIG